MKAISPMIATVLLIAFTVAVGGILAVWFSSYTKTQTSSVSKNSACSTNLADVKGIYFNSTSKELTFMITNGGSQNITITSIVIRCGNSAGTVKLSALTSGTFVPANSQNITSPITINSGTYMNQPLTSCNSESDIGISITYKCSGGGTSSAECPVGTCFS